MSPVRTSAAEVAATYHRQGFNCAESVLMGVMEAMGVEGFQAGVATGFGGGIGRRGDTCGAVTGAAMAIGIKANRVNPGQKDLYDTVHRAVGILQEEFARSEGSLYCRDLIGYDLLDPADHARFRADPLVREGVCGKAVASAARIAAGLIEEFGF